MVTRSTWGRRGGSKAKRGGTTTARSEPGDACLRRVSRDTECAYRMRLSRRRVLKMTQRKCSCGSVARNWHDPACQSWVSRQRSNTQASIGDGRKETTIWVYIRAVWLLRIRRSNRLNWNGLEALRLYVIDDWERTPKLVSYTAPILTRSTLRWRLKQLTTPTWKD